MAPDGAVIAEGYEVGERSFVTWAPDGDLDDLAFHGDPLEKETVKRAPGTSDMEIAFPGQRFTGETPKNRSRLPLRNVSFQHRFFVTFPIEPAFHWPFQLEL
jgi:hypothetical protein